MRKALVKYRSMLLFYSVLLVGKTIGENFVINFNKFWEKRKKEKNKESEIFYVDKQTYLLLFNYQTKV